MLLAVAAVVVALWFFTEHDAATTSAPATAGAPGQPLAASDPTARPFAADLRRGNVVLLAAPRQVSAARALALDVAGPAEPSVREAGQAILVRSAPLRPAAGGARVLALAQGRILRARDARDPALRAFAEYWLGRAAG